MKCISFRVSLSFSLHFPMGQNWLPVSHVGSLHVPTAQAEGEIVTRGHRRGDPRSSRVETICWWSEEWWKMSLPIGWNVHLSSIRGPYVFWPHKCPMRHKSGSTGTEWGPREKRSVNHWVSDSIRASPFLSQYLPHHQIQQSMQIEKECHPVNLTDGITKFVPYGIGDP